MLDQFDRIKLSISKETSYRTFSYRLALNVALTHKTFNHKIEALQIGGYMWLTERSS